MMQLLASAFLQTRHPSQENTWVTEFKIESSQWAGPARFHLEGRLVGETSVLTFQKRCIDETLNREQYRLVAAQGHTFLIEACIEHIEVELPSQRVRMLLYLNASAPIEQPKLKTRLSCFMRACTRPPHEVDSAHILKLDT